MFHNITFTLNHMNTSSDEYMQFASRAKEEVSQLSLQKCASFITKEKIRNKAESYLLVVISTLAGFGHTGECGLLNYIRLLFFQIHSYFNKVGGYFYNEVLRLR